MLAVLPGEILNRETPTLVADTQGLPPSINVADA
jgi:hypothetical protein